MNRKTALATATLTLAAEGPDLDVFSGFRGPVFGFAHHRGFTHSFLGVPLVSVVVVAFVYLIWRMVGAKIKAPDLPPRWGLLYLYACIAGMSHILLDFTNNYGVRPFWPFSERWYSWDIVFIFEPIMFGLLLAGLVLPSFFSLINQEIGARQRGFKGRFAATLALISVVTLWGVRDYEHRRAVSILESRVYEGAEPIRASAYPYWWNPFKWYGVVETKTFFAQTMVDPVKGEVDPAGEMRIRYKPQETEVTLAAKKSAMGRAFLDWARYPVTETEDLGPGRGYLVRFRDLRYDYPGSSGRVPLGASVELDRELHPIKATMGGRTQTKDLD